MSGLNGFNSIARAYDRLSRIVFGDTILRAQRQFLHRLPAKGKLLIIGGGTGEILPGLVHSRRDLDVWFVEASSVMIESAKARIPEHHRIVFIHGTEANIPTTVKFNAVITNFFLDLFPPAKLALVIQKIASAMDRDGLWLCADFCNDDHKRWKGVMLKTMYAFFRLTTRIEAKSLPPWLDLLREKGFSIEDLQQFYGGFIWSLVLRNTETSGYPDKMV